MHINYNSFVSASLYYVTVVLYNIIHSDIFRILCRPTMDVFLSLQSIQSNTIFYYHNNIMACTRTAHHNIIHSAQLSTFITSDTRVHGVRRIEKKKPFSVESSLYKYARVDRNATLLDV